MCARTPKKLCVCESKGGDEATSCRRCGARVMVVSLLQRVSNACVVDCVLLSISSRTGDFVRQRSGKCGATSEARVAGGRGGKKPTCVNNKRVVCAALRCIVRRQCVRACGMTFVVHLTVECRVCGCVAAGTVPFGILLHSVAQLYVNIAPRARWYRPRHYS